ncbi:MAG: acetyl-CoA carboxylase biotin carboxyl carrier protein [Gemmatimonadetes bacterium]|nr:acetyl-CoA carboxylase biotin carboxyl carrier protein [Gemmatimonadota bacterium]
MDLDFVRGLILAIDESGIDSIEISRGGTRIRIAKTAAPAAVSAAPALPAAPVHAAAPAFAGSALVGPPQGTAGDAADAPPSGATAPVADNLTEIRSPMVGTFYRSPSPEAPSYVEVGSRVTKGQTLCILEAMKLMNELEAEMSGIVREILIEDAEPVEYGQPLFRIEPLP